MTDSHTELGTTGLDSTDYRTFQSSKKLQCWFIWWNDFPKVMHLVSELKVWSQATWFYVNVLQSFCVSTDTWAGMLTCPHTHSDRNILSLRTDKQNNLNKMDMKADFSLLDGAAVKVNILKIKKKNFFALPTAFRSSPARDPTRTTAATHTAAVTTVGS